jgi:hypothetical protein
LATKRRKPLWLFAFPQASSFALKSAQIVQLGATHAAGANEIDVIDNRRVDGEDTLNALAEADLPNGDRLAQSGVISRDYSAFESLQPLFVTFPDANMDAYGVSRPELRMSLSTSVLADELADKSVLHI